MPCRDYYDDHPQDYYGPKLANKDKEIKRLRKQISFAESALCLTLNTFQQFMEGVKYDFDDRIKTNPLDVMDIEEAGINRKALEQWWKKHKALDLKHRAEEAARKACAELAGEDPGRQLGSKSK